MCLKSPKSFEVHWILLLHYGNSGCVTRFGCLRPARLLPTGVLGRHLVVRYNQLPHPFTTDLLNTRRGGVSCPADSCLVRYATLGTSNSDVIN